MKGLNFRTLFFYGLFTLTTILCCSGNLAFAKVIAPITAYLSKKSLVTHKESLDEVTFTRTVEPNDKIPLRIKRVKPTEAASLHNAALLLKQQTPPTTSLHV